MLGAIVLAISGGLSVFGPAIQAFFTRLGAAIST